jgi:serine/threonine protein kinase
MSLRPGTRLGPYEVVDLLGEGGMGDVYRARDTRLGREVALKILRAEISDDGQRLARFEREAKLLASLSHPNIATIHDLGRSGDLPYLVLELVPGKTLGERLAEGPLPVDEAIRVAAAVARALEAAHENGVIHRDLKPANIKITPEGRIKVLDFGIAKATAPEVTIADRSESPTRGLDTTEAGLLLGTPSYMSPEQARGRAVDHRTDLWAFGCVLYECLTGRKAFLGTTVVEVLAAVLDPHPSWDLLPASTPARIRSLLSASLEKDPNRRPQSARSVRQDLEAVTAEQEGVGETARTQPRLTQATFADGIESFPAWSPDGTEILFSRDVGAVRKVFRRTLGQERESQLTQGSHDDIQPVFSPDGGAILFVRCREAGRRLEPRDVFGQYDGADLFKLDPSSGKETRLLENAFNPSFSPDGKSVALDASWAGPAGSGSWTRTGAIRVR